MKLQFLSEVVLNLQVKPSVVCTVSSSLARFKSLMRLAVLIMSPVVILSGCMTAPGMNADHLKEGESLFFESSRSSDKAVVVGEGEAEAALVPDVRKITAGLIVELEKAQKIQVARDSSVEQLKAVSEYEYRVGPADILSITVWDHPELTIPAGSERKAAEAGNRIARDGTIFFPYAGTVKVGGLTTPEIRHLLTKKLSRFIEDVKLDVRVASFNFQRVYVVGQVKKPSVKNITNVPPTLVEMINQSGGFTKEADSRNITLTRNSQTYRLDLLSLYENGDSSQNILLQHGDIVNVWDRDLNKVFVMGEVNKPGSFLMNKQRKSLAEALSDAGGVDQKTSDPGQIFVIRGSAPKAAVFHLDARTPEALILADRFRLLPRDVVYVDTAKIVRWNRVISNVSNTLSTLNNASNVNFPLFKGDQ